MAMYRVYYFRSCTGMYPMALNDNDNNKPSPTKIIPSRYKYYGFSCLKKNIQRHNFTMKNKLGF